MKQANSALLAPYGSVKWLALASKVGVIKKPPMLAPYGALRHLSLASKVGVIKKPASVASA